MTLKRFLRLLALAVIIAMASIIPVPITFAKKDNLPKYLIEQLDTKENEDDEDDIKELF
jgi:hypothetical protein